ncbi:hypothetical protein D3C79_1039610 [compost metagenome]
MGLNSQLVGERGQHLLGPVGRVFAQRQCGEFVIAVVGHRQLIQGTILELWLGLP